jgi:hypothetical protein
MASGATNTYTIPYPLPNDGVDVANDIKLVALRVDDLLSTVPAAIAEQTTNALFQIIPLDDMSYYFDGVQDTFEPTYDATKVSVTNPYRVMMTINGLVQATNFEDYVNLAPPVMQHGFVLTANGDFKFLSIPQAGDKFDARIMPGAQINEKERKYPFDALDIVMGGD